MEKVTLFEPADIQIYVRGKGIVLKEKSLIAFRMEGNKVKTAAVGDEAAALKNSEPDIVVASPLHQGQVSDFAVAEKLFQYLMEKAAGRYHFGKSKIALCIPDSETYDSVSNKAYEDVICAACNGKISVLAHMPGTIEEVLNNAPEKIIKKYNLLIEIGKDEPDCYVRECARESVQYAAKNGVSREKLIEMIQNVEISE